MLVLKWHLITDFRNVFIGKIGDHKMPRPHGWSLVAFIVGKVAFFSMAFVVPMLFHPPLVVLLYYTIAAFTAGVTLSIIFLLAHVVENAEFPAPPGQDGRIDNAEAIHQIETTVDFARDSRLISWLLGGLNFQIEHHLFPRICHVHYPAISKIVEQMCREHGVKYAEHKTVFAGIAAHYRWLRKMGRDEPQTPAPAPAPAGPVDASVN
jgi:linoleoyl-CoA desaturase